MDSSCSVCRYYLVLLRGILMHINTFLGVFNFSVMCYKAPLGVRPSFVLQHTYVYIPVCAYICAHTYVCIPMCVQTCVYIPMCAYLCAYIPMCAYLCVPTCVYIPMCTNLCLHTYVYIPMCAYLCAQTCVDIPACTYLCVHTYVYIPDQGLVRLGKLVPIGTVGQYHRQSNLYGI